MKDMRIADRERKLVIVGGRLEADNAAVFGAIRELSGGRIAVLPTASMEPEESARSTVEAMALHGIAAEAVVLTSINCGESAFDPAIVERLRDLGGIYFTGGDQSLITGSLVQDGKPTPVLDAIRAIWRQGGLIAGSSAGAAIMCDPMITGGYSLDALLEGVSAEPSEDRLTMAPGLGFFPHGMVDQHFLKRGRIGRLAAGLLASGQRLGFGIDENTALVVEGTQGRVLGENGVVVLDMRRRRAQLAARGIDRLSFTYLDRDDALDLVTLDVRPGPAKRRSRRTSHGVAIPEDERGDAFASYEFHGLILAASLDRRFASAPATALAADLDGEDLLQLAVARDRDSRIFVERAPHGDRVTATNLKLSFARHAAVSPVQSPAAQPMAQPTMGRLILLGSAPRANSLELVEELRSLLTSPVGIVATASADALRAARAQVAFLGKAGIEAVDLGLTQRALDDPDRRRAIVERIRGLRSFLVTGGDQQRLVQALQQNAAVAPVLQALAETWREGATLVAVGGGAAALSTLMIAGGSNSDALRYGVVPDRSRPGLFVRPGLGLFEGGMVDQRLLGSNRLARLIVACAEHAVTTGFGLCEDAGLVIEPDGSMRVIGRQGVAIVTLDPRRGIGCGDVFSARNVRLSVFGPASGIVLPGSQSGEADEKTRGVFASLIAGLGEVDGSTRITVSATGATSARIDIESDRIGE